MGKLIYYFRLLDIALEMKVKTRSSQMLRGISYLILKKDVTSF